MKIKFYIIRNAVNQNQCHAIIKIIITQRYDINSLNNNNPPQYTLLILIYEYKLVTVIYHRIHDNRKIKVSRN